MHDRSAAKYTKILKEIKTTFVMLDITPTKPSDVFRILVLNTSLSITAPAVKKTTEFLPSIINIFYRTEVSVHTYRSSCSQMFFKNTFFYRTPPVAAFKHFPWISCSEKSRKTHTKAPAIESLFSKAIYQACNFTEKCNLSREFFEIFSENFLK